MTSRLFVVRHGHRTDWLKENKESVHKVDVSLSQSGLDQAQDVCGFLSSELDQRKVKIDLILSSPFIRCIETIHPFAKKFGISIGIELGLFEFVFDPRFLKSYKSPKEMNAIFKDLHILEDYESILRKNELPLDRGYEAGVTGFRKRSNLFLERVIKKFEGQNILLVSHAANCVAIQEYFTGQNTTRSKRTENTDIKCGAPNVSYFEKSEEDEKFRRIWNGRREFVRNKDTLEDFNWDFSHM